MPALRMSLEMTGLTEQIAKLEEMDHTATRHLYDGMKALVAVADKTVVADMSAIARRNLSSMMGGIRGGMKALAPANPVLPGRMIEHNTYIKGNYDVLGVVKSKNRRYMKMAQNGRAGGKFPPQRQMRKWVADVMGITDKKENRRVAAVVGFAIAHGIQGTPSLEKSRDSVMTVLWRVMKTEMDQLAEELAVKGGSNGG